jgi:DNA-binding NarL/FixJ family response regulator
VRNGLRTLLESDPNFAIIGEASNGREAIQVADKLKPDLILLDLSMPKMDGTMAIQEIKRRNPKTKILVLTMHNTEDNIVAALQAGADGYLLKDDTHVELLHGIETVLAGRYYLSPGVSKKVIKGFLAGREKCGPFSPWKTVTRREKEVLKLIAEGYGNKEIAEQLFISVKTVEKHRANLREKLDLHSASALTKYAMEKGLTEE